MLSCFLKRDDLLYCLTGQGYEGLDLTGVGLDLSVDNMLAGAVDLADSRTGNDFAYTLRGNARGRYDAYTAIGLLDKLSDHTGAFEGCGMTARGEQFVTATTYEGFEGCRGIGRTELVESTMKGYLHGGCQLYNLAGTLFVDGSVCLEKSYYDCRGSQLLAKHDIVADALVFGLVIAEIAPAGTDEDSGAQSQLACTEVDCGSGGSGSSTLEVVTEFDTGSATIPGINGRLDGIAADFNFHS